MKLVNIHKLFFAFGLLLPAFGYGRLQAQTLSLHQCTEAALVRNKSLSVVRNQISLSEQREQEARSNYWPKATASADYKYFTNLPYQLLPLSVFNGPAGQYKEAQFGVPHNLGANIQLVMPIYNPQIGIAVSTAKNAGELAVLQVEKSEEQVIFEVANLYYNGQILQHQLHFVDTNLLHVARLLNTVQLLWEQGLAKRTEVGKIELQQAQLVAQRAQLEGKLQQVFNGLKFLMGLDLGQTISITSEIEQPDQLTYPVSTAVEVRIAQAQNQLLINELKWLKKSKQPTVSLVVNYGLTGFGYDQQPEPFLKIFPLGFIGVQASYPIWNRPTRFKIAQKEAEILGSRFQLEQIQAQHDLQMANALVQKSTAKGNIPAIRQQIKLADSVFQQTLAQQQQGLATLTDVLLADNALREAQTNYLNALIEYLKADLELKKASGSMHSNLK